MKEKYADILRQMTLTEKAVFLSGKDVWHTHDIERLGIPAIALADGPSGLRRQAGEGDHLGLNASTKATCIPSSATYANSWDESLAERLGAVVGRDAANQGVNVLLGPGLNTKRSPLCGRSFEYYSEDPYLAGKMAAGFIRGVQSQGVAACAKHFAANSQEMLRMSSDSVLDERTLRELYLTNFEIAVKEGKPRAVMTSYNKLNGTYTNEHPHLLGDILRGEWGWQGMVVTDWGGSNSYVEGVRQGMNLEMPAAGEDSACQLVEAVRQGRIPEDVVDERVAELLDVILSLKDTKPAPVDVEVQHQAAREAAEKSIVLLKNEGDLLPLDRDCRVAVIGDFALAPRYQGAGSSMVNAERVENTIELLADYFPHNCGWDQGFDRLGRADESMTRQVIALAKQADVVLMYMGLPESYETEGLDRTHLRLPQNQIDLLEQVYAVNPHIVVVVSAGSAVEMPWIDHCEALVWGGLGGQASASAVLNVLRGKVNPSGKLSETFPVAYSDLPVSHYYPGEEATSEYREGIYVGYRYAATVQEPVCFPFGHGLSYTNFAYSDLDVNQDGVSFTLTNTGGRDGDEVAQLYVALPDAEVFRPARELKGFARIHLAAGESKRVRIPFDDYTFRYFNVGTERFEIEGGMYEVMIASSSEDIRLQAMLNVEGTEAANPYADTVRLDCYKTGQVMNVSTASFETLLEHRLPRHQWDRSQPLDMNDALRQMIYARNPICRLIVRVLSRMIDRALKKGKPNLNLLFIYNIPFRGMAKMMGGMVTMDMAEDIRLIANGHFFRGTGRLVKHFFCRPKLSKYNE